MRCWKSRADARSVPRGLAFACLLSILCALAGCGPLLEQTPGHLTIRTAQILPAVDGSVLLLGLDCRLSGPMRDALDHGIPVTLRVTLRVSVPRQARSATRAKPMSTSQLIELRYFPLSRRYQLRELDGGVVRSFTAPAAMIDALAGLRLGLPEAFDQLPADSHFAVDVTIDRSALPGALRLPATLEPAWWLSAATYRWTG